MKESIFYNERFLKKIATSIILPGSNVLFFIALAFMGCAKRMPVTEPRKFTVTCDTITINDSSWYQPVIFNFTSTYIHHTNNLLEECTFRIVEKGHEELFVESEDKRLYMVKYDLKKNGHIGFRRIGRTTYFRIVNVVDNNYENDIPPLPDSVVLSSERY